MADAFEGGSPSERTNNEFKIFGMGVNEFSLAVASFDAIVNALEKKAAEAKKNTDETVRKEKDIADEFNEAAEKQTDAANIQLNVAKEIERRERQNVKRQNDVFGDMKKSWYYNVISPLEFLFGPKSSFKEAVWRLSVTTEHFGKVIKDKFVSAVESFKETAKKGLSKGFDSIKGALSSVVGILKDFGARFVAIFTLVNIVTRVFETLIGQNTARARSIRLFGANSQLDSVMPYVTAAGRRGAPISPEDSLEIIRNLNVELRNSQLIASQVGIDIVGMTAEISRAYNASAESISAFFGRALSTTDATATDIRTTFAVIGQEAEALGLNVDELVQSIAQLPHLAQQFRLETQQGRMELARAAAVSRFFGSNIEEVRSYGDAFLDIGTAIKSSVGLQALGVTGIDASKLVTGGMDDPTGLIVDVLSQLSKTGIGQAAARGDRAALRTIFGAGTGLESVFRTFEDLQKALTASVDLQGKDRQERISELMNRGSYEEQAAKSLETLVSRGKGFQETLEDYVQRIAQSIASFISGPFNDLLDFIRKMLQYVEKIASSWIFGGPTVIGDKSQLPGYTSPDLTKEEAKLAPEFRNTPEYAEQQKIREQLREAAKGSDESLREAIATIRELPAPSIDGSKITILGLNGQYVGTIVLDTKGTKSNGN